MANVETPPKIKIVRPFECVFCSTGKLRLTIAFPAFLLLVSPFSTTLPNGIETDAFIHALTSPPGPSTNTWNNQRIPVHHALSRVLAAVETHQLLPGPTFWPNTWLAPPPPSPLLLHTATPLARPTPSTPNPCIRPAQLPGAAPDLSAATFQIFDESHTMGNSLRWILMKNPLVEFCGYS